MNYRINKVGYKGSKSRATPSGQPALVASDQAASRLAPTGFDQAQGLGQ